MNRPPSAPVTCCCYSAVLCQHYPFFCVTIKSFKWLAFIMESRCVHFEVWTAVAVAFWLEATLWKWPRNRFFSPRTSVFPCQYHSTIAPYSFIHLPPTLYNVFLPVLQFSPVTIITPLLHICRDLHVAVTKRQNDEILETSKKQSSFWTTAHFLETFFLLIFIDGLNNVFLLLRG